MGGKSPAALERVDHPKIGSAVGIVNCLFFICFFLKPAKESCKCFCELVLDWDLRANHCPSVTVQKVLKASLIRNLREALSWVLWSVSFSSWLASILHKSLRQTETYVMILSSGGKWVWESQLWLFGCSYSTEVAGLITHSTLLFLTWHTESNLIGFPLTFVLASVLVPLRILHEVSKGVLGGLESFRGRACLPGQEKWNPVISST